MKLSNDKAPRVVSGSGGGRDADGKPRGSGDGRPVKKDRVR